MRAEVTCLVGTKGMLPNLVNNHVTTDNWRSSYLQLSARRISSPQVISFFGTVSYTTNRSVSTLLVGKGGGGVCDAQIVQQHIACQFQSLIGVFSEQKCHPRFIAEFTCQQVKSRIDIAFVQLS